MYAVRLAHEDDVDAFRDAARGLIGAGVPPEQVSWSAGAVAELFGAPPPDDGKPMMVPAGFPPLLKDAICHNDPQRFGWLYALLWRLTHGEPKLLAIVSDPLVHRLMQMQKAVRRDMHKMTAFLRFRRMDDEAGEHYVAWFEPEHHILRRVAPFFVERFSTMRWTIVTPSGALAWDGAREHFDPAATRNVGPTGDDMEAWWRSYYRSTFNPARANPRAMRAEMPKKYWRNLPEAALIPDLLAEAETRTGGMIAAPATEPRKRIAAPVLPTAPVPSGDLAAVAAEARSCRRCPLHGPATQTVFGEGPPDAPLVFVGEQPGDQEDLAGTPFVGPAGQMFDRALAEAGIDRSRVYVTNAVKHFKYVPRGKRRIHQKPNVVEMEQCRWWLDQELALIDPQLTVALGATAARSLTGRTVGIERERGARRPFRDGRSGFITVHPSYLLRLPDAEAQAREYARFVEDLRAIAVQVPAVRLHAHAAASTAVT